MSNQRIALVTGANQGVGFQVAKELAANGVTVYVGSRDLERGEAAAKEIGNGAIALQIDVTDQASIRAAAERLRTEFGRLDLLVNNAAISNTSRGDRTLEEFSKLTRASKIFSGRGPRHLGDERLRCACRVSSHVATPAGIR